MTATAPSAPPDVIFLLADDLRPDAIGALGGRDVHTPHLDELVRRGQTLLRAYATNPVCVASRAEILTGCSCFSNGVFPGYSSSLDERLETWPQALRRAGYRTCFVGKWHLPGRPSQRGYDPSEALFAEHAQRLAPALERDAFDRPITGYVNWAFETDDGRLEDPGARGGLTPDVDARITDAALRVLRGESEQPLFLHVNFTAPHDPLFWPPGKREAWAAREVALPKNFLPSHPFDNENLHNRDELLLPAPRSAEDVRRELAIYYAVIEELDKQVGRIVDALQETRRLSRTVLIFSSDHGLAKGSHGLFGKLNFYEHSTRVPLVIAGPGLAQGVRRAALVELADLYPTVCELVGAPVSETVEAQSFAAVLQGKTEVARGEVFGGVADSQRMLCTDRYKLIEYPRSARRQFFDLQEDPEELVDLANRPEHAAAIERLSAQLRRRQELARDPLLRSEHRDTSR